MQGIAYVLAIGWLGVGIRRGAGRRSGGEKKERQGDRWTGELRGTGERRVILLLSCFHRFFAEFTESLLFDSLLAKLTSFRL